MATKNWGYCDLSISKEYEFNKLQSIEKLGFHTIAVNSHIEEVSDEPKKKKKKGEPRTNPDFFPSPIEIPKDISDNTKLNILQRITIEFSDSSIAHRMTQSENLKKYDIIAVVPKTLQAFQYACGTMDIDIISFEPLTRSSFKVTRKLYRQAVDRGLFFELMYAPCIKDPTAMKNIISTSHNYHAVGKSKNIIITSSTENPMYLRDVHDVVNLGFLFGLNNNQSLEVIRNNPRKIILKAEGRRSGKLFLKIRPVNEETKLQ